MNFMTKMTLMFTVTKKISCFFKTNGIFNEVNQKIIDELDELNGKTDFKKSTCKHKSVSTLVIKKIK